MSHSFDPKQVAAELAETTPAAMDQAMQAAEPEIRRLLAQALTADSSPFHLSDTERNELRMLAATPDIPFDQLLSRIYSNRFLFQSIFVRMASEQQRTRKRKISPKDVADAFDGKRPPGWDDLVPEDLIDNDRDASSETQ